MRLPGASPGSGCSGPRCSRSAPRCASVPGRSTPGFHPSRRSSRSWRGERSAFREALAAAREDPHLGLRLYLEHIGEAATDADTGWMNLHLVAHTRRDCFTRDMMRALSREGVAVLKQAFRRLPSRSRAEADERARLLQAAAFGIVLQSLIDPGGEVASLDLARRLLAGRRSLQLIEPGHPGSEERQCEHSPW